MLKLGIWQKQAFAAAPPKGWLGRRVSLDLLTMPASPSAEDIGVFECLMPYVRLSSGVYRTTHHGRFRNLDPLVNSVLAKGFPETVELRVEDWAASDCLTSVEWWRSLSEMFPRLRLAASDTLLFLVAIEDLESGEQFVCEPGGTPLQNIRRPFVIRMEPPEPWLFLLNRLMYHRALRRWRELAHLVQAPENWKNPLCDEPIRKNGFRLRKLSLVHPEAIRLMRNDSRFTVRQHSIFESVSEPRHVVRSMNILNRAYFSDEKLAKACRNALDCLCERGIWIVGRTVKEEPPEHHATIFRKLSSGVLEVIERTGPGSEIESIAMEISRSHRP